MNPAEFSQRLLQTDPDSPEAAALAHDLVEDAHYPATLVLDGRLTSPDNGERMKARHVLAELGELALAPLAGHMSTSDMDTELWTLRTIAEEFLAFRKRSASVLKDLLSNRHRALRTPEGFSAFQQPPGTRVCDLAFVLLQRILRLKISPAAFLGMTAGDRDKKIKEFQASREYQSAFEEQI